MAQNALHRSAAQPRAADSPPGAAAGKRTHFNPQAPLEDQKRAFLRLISHELRTPLNSILGFSEILSAELLGPLGAPQYKEYAEIIRGSGKRLLTLVNQVLEIGRLEGLELVARAEEVAPALEDALAAASEDLAARGATGRTVAEAPDLLAMFDPWGLRTVLGHLARNAAAASPQGGEVRLIARRAGGFVDVFIEDDGDGIDLAELPRLMLPFEQGESAMVRRGEGAGLGLTIAALTCQAMGAQLSLRNRPQGGVSARVRLPVAR